MDKIISIEQFKGLLKDGMSIMVGGFMACGTAEPLMDAIVESKIKDLTIICNDAGLHDMGVGKLINFLQVKKLIASHIGLNPTAQKQMLLGELEVELVPQGTLAERIRSGGAGLGGVLTKTGLGTIVAEGKDVIKVDGEDFLLEKPLKADMTILRGSFVDSYGNVIYSGTTRNFNPVMATAGEIVVVWAESMDESLDKEKIMTPHVFVDYIVRN